MTALDAQAQCWCPWCLPDGAREVEAGPHRFVLGDPVSSASYPLRRDDAPYGWRWRCPCGATGAGGMSPSSADAYWAWRMHAGLSVWVPWRPW